MNQKPYSRLVENHHQHIAAAKQMMAHVAAISQLAKRHGGTAKMGEGVMCDELLVDIPEQNMAAFEKDCADLRSGLLHE